MSAVPPDYLKGRIAVVTGGCSGMGLAMALNAARDGMVLIVMDMDVAQFPETEKTLKAAGAPEVFCAKTDVSQYAEVAKVAQEVASPMTTQQTP